MLKMSLQVRSGSDFGSRAQKCSKRVSRGGLGAIEGSGTSLYRILYVKKLLHHSVIALAEDETTIQGSHGRDCSSRRKSMRLFAFSLNKCISNHVSSMRPRELSLSPNSILILMIQPATNHVTTNHNPHFYTNKS